MTPCRSGRPDNRKGTVTPSARDVTHHGTKPGKKDRLVAEPVPREVASPLQNSCYITFKHKDRTPAPNKQFRPQLFGSELPKNPLFKGSERNSRRHGGPSPSLRQSQPAEAPLNAVGPPDGLTGAAGRRADGQTGGGQTGGNQSEKSEQHSSGVSNSSVACEIPNSQSRCFKSCLIRSWAARSVTTTWAVRAFSVVLMAQTWM